MKLFKSLIIFIFFIQCSFDNRTGIWNNKNKIKDEKEVFGEFKTLSSSKNAYSQIKIIDKNIRFKINKPFSNLNWNEKFYNNSNNLDNLFYQNSNQLVFKSKKVTTNKASEYFLINEDNVFLSDQEGNIIIFSLIENNILFKYNFYKKKLKKIDKFINIVVQGSIIYASDNIGFLYALDYEKKKVLWAKNYKVPFRSNIKIINNKLVTANQNNELFFFDINTGDIIRSIPTEETIIKNKFINNLSASKEKTFFLNTYGSLYAVSNESLRIRWFINLNQSLDINPSNLFNGKELVNNNDIIVATSNHFTYVIDTDNGSIIYKKNFTSQFKPLIINQYLFVITNNDFLISMDIKTGEIIYSYDLNQNIADFLKTKKKQAKFKNFMMLNNKIYIFLDNSFYIVLKVNGQVESIRKLPSKISSNISIVKKSLLYLDRKNRVSIVD